MKKYLFIGLFLSVGIISFNKIGTKKALAWDINDINNYITIDSIIVDHNGNLSVDYHRNQATSLLIGSSSSLPAYTGYILLSINGTSTPQFTTDNLGRTENGNCGSGGHMANTFGALSQIPYGNNITVSSVYDQSLGMEVPTTDITSVTNISFSLGITFFDPCNPGTTTHGFLSSLTYTPNLVAIPVQGQLILPIQSSTVGSFPNWEIQLTANRASTSTGIVSVEYAQNVTSTFNLEDSSTYTMAGNSVLFVSIPVGNNIVSNFSTSTYYARVGVLDSNSSDTIYSAPILFYTAPNATINPINPDYNIALPEDGSTVGQFDSFILTLSNVTANNSVNITPQVIFSQSSSSLLQCLNFQGTRPDCFQTFGSPQLLQNYASSGIPLLHANLNGTISSGTWYAQSQLFANITGVQKNNVLAVSGMITFNVSSTLPSSTYNPTGFISNFVSASNEILSDNNGCSITNGLANFNLGDVFCGIGQLASSTLAILQSATNGSFNAAGTAIQNNFLIAPIISFNQDIASAASSTYVSTSIILNPTHLTSTFQGMSFTIYTSSTTNWIEDKAGFDYKSFIDKVLYLLTGLFILGMIIGIAKSISNQQT